MSTSNKPSKAQRRTREQWQQLIQELQHSGESAKAFCAARSIGYASFCQWRKRLLPQEATPPQVNDAPEFIDLAALAGGVPGGWRIVLSLGNGMELRLSQG